MKASIYFPRIGGNYGDYSGGGLSSLFDEVTVIAIDGTPIPTADRFAPNAVGIVRHVGTWIAQPATCYHRGTRGNERALVGPMSGGCYIAPIGSPDDLWRDKVGRNVAVSLHDRYETQADYDSNFN